MDEQRLFTTGTTPPIRRVSAEEMEREAASVERETGDHLVLVRAADIIEAAAKVAEEFTSAAWIAHDMRSGTFPQQSKPGAAIAAAIRALAPGVSTSDAPAQDSRPTNCCFRLQDEGKPYPRSSCQACGRGVMSGLGNKCSVIEPAPAQPAPSGWRDWTEDAGHENGNYDNICIRCHEMFVGYKRRVLCRACAGEQARLAAAPPPPHPAQAESDNLKRLHNEAEADLEECWRGRDRLEDRIRQLEDALAASRAEVERWKSTLDAVLSETAKELGCEPDNEEILAAIAASQAEVERLHERLEDNYAFDGDGNRIEMEPGSIPNGIECRDETIKLQNESIANLTEALAASRAEGERWRVRAEHGSKELAASQAEVERLTDELSAISDKNAFDRFMADVEAKVRELIEALVESLRREDALAGALEAITKAYGMGGTRDDADRAWALVRAAHAASKGGADLASQLGKEGG